MTAKEALLVRLAAVIVGYSVWLELWMVFDISIEMSALGGFVAYVLSHVGFERQFRATARHRSDRPTSRQEQIRVRIAALEGKIEPDRAELAKLREELGEIEQRRGYGRS